MNSIVCLSIIGLLLKEFHAQRESHLVQSTCINESSHNYHHHCGKAVDGLTCYLAQTGFEVSQLFL